MELIQRFLEIQKAETCCCDEDSAHSGDLETHGSGKAAGGQVIENQKRVGAVVSGKRDGGRFSGTQGGGLRKQIAWVADLFEPHRSR